MSSEIVGYHGRHSQGLSLPYPLALTASRINQNARTSAINVGP